MSACVGNYFRLASLEKLRNVEIVVKSLRTWGGGLLWAALQPVPTFCCLAELRPAHRSLGTGITSPASGHTITSPLPQRGLQNPNTRPNSNRSQCCASLRVNPSFPCLSTARQHTSSPESIDFMFFFPTPPLLHP